jgi:hypothetical protein
MQKAPEFSEWLRKKRPPPTAANNVPENYAGILAPKRKEKGRPGADRSGPHPGQAKHFASAADNHYPMPALKRVRQERFAQQRGR